MKDQERLIDFERSANECWRWIQAADHLEYAAQSLYGLHKAASTKMKLIKEGSVPAGFFMLSQTCYFKGKCLELHLKSLYIKSGKPITNGKGDLMKKTHNLNQLCIVVNFPVSQEEKNTLEKLTDAVEFWGTYPVPLKYKKWRKDTPRVEGLQPIYSWGPIDDENFSRLLSRLKLLNK